MIGTAAGAIAATALLFSHTLATTNGSVPRGIEPITLSCPRDTIAAWVPANTIASVVVMKCARPGDLVEPK